MRKWLDHYAVLVLLILVMVGSLILSGSWSRYQDYLTAQSRLAENSARSSAAEIDLLISGLRRSVRIFATEKSDLIGQLAEDPDDEILQAEMRRKLLEHFPEYFASTVTDDVGIPITDEFGEGVGQMCQNNLLEFAAQHHPQQVFIHPSPVAHHFDVMAHWQDEAGERGVFFVSFHPDMIARLLDAGAIPGHNLILLKRGSPNLIEITRDGAREHLQREYHLSEEEQARVLVSTPVPGTLWDLVDIPSPALFAEARRAILAKDGLILLIFIAVTLFMWFLVKREVRSRSQAQQLSREKSEFLSTMSHEIRTPLNSVIGFAELLASSHLNAEQIRYVNGVRQSGHSLLTLINDILDLSKMDAGKLQTEKIPFDLRELVDDTVQMFAEKAYRKGLTLNASVPVDIPVNVIGDPTHVRQVLVNLIGNAIKFTEQGRVLIRVSREEGEGQKKNQAKPELILRLSVEDSGIGLAPQDRARLFERFTQADTSTTRKYGGTGLGLAISRRLVGLMGGEIGVNSEPGLGAEFWFTVRFGIHDVALARETRMMTETLRGALSGLRVQVVEHNDHCRESVYHNLRLLDVDFLLEDSAARALLDLRKEEASRSEFDVLLLDADTPDLTGPDLVRVVQSDERIHQAPIVMMTGFGDLARRNEAEKMGIRYILSRPFGARDLYRILGEASGRLAPSVQTAMEEIDDQLDLGLKVLVVDDNEMNLSVAQGMLKLLGCTAMTASSGSEALGIADQHSLDLVLLDCEMPEMDGFETLRRLHQDGHLDRAGRVPVVALTANAGEEDRNFCIASGFDDFLSKPVTLSILRDVLTHWTPGEREILNDRHAPAEVESDEDDFADLPVVDDGIIEQMRRLNTQDNPHFFLELLNNFETESRRHQQQLQGMRGTQDAENLRQVLHSLKGAAALVGARRVEAVCEGALKDARAGELGSLPDHLMNIDTELNHARDDLGQYL